MIMQYKKIEDTDALGAVVKLAYEAKVEQALNGSYTLRFKTPETIPAWSMLKATTPEGLQPFYVTDVQRNNDGYDVTAHHITELLRGVYLPAVNADRSDIQDVVAQVQTAIDKNAMDLPFKLIAEQADGGKHTFNTEGTSVLDAILEGEHSLIGEWGGKLYREGFTLRIGSREGVKTDILLARRKNLLDATQGVNIKSIVTRLHLTCDPRGEDGERTKVTYTADSPLIAKYPVVVEKSINIPSDEADSIEDLRRTAERMWREGIDKPEESLEVKPATLDGQNIKIGESALIYYEEEDTYAYIDLMAYEYDPLNEEFISLNFGHLPKTLETVMKKSVKENTQDLRASTAMMGGAISDNAFHIGKNAGAIGGLGNALNEQKERFSMELKRTKEEFKQVYTEIENDFSKFRSSITQTAREIKAEVEHAQRTADSNTTELSRLSIRADGISSEVSKAKEAANSAYYYASKVDQKADSISYTVSRVEQTANSASSRVSQLQQTINGWSYAVGYAGRLSTVMTVNSNGVTIANLYAHAGHIGQFSARTVVADSIRISGKDIVPH